MSLKLNFCNVKCDIEHFNIVKYYQAWRDLVDSTLMGLGGGQ